MPPQKHEQRISPIVLVEETLCVRLHQCTQNEAEIGERLEVVQDHAARTPGPRVRSLRRRRQKRRPAERFLIPFSVEKCERFSITTELESTAMTRAPCLAKTACLTVSATEIDERSSSEIPKKRKCVEEHWVDLAVASIPGTLLTRVYRSFQNASAPTW